MKTAIIIHGMPNKENYYNPTGDSESNCHWLPWIQHELIIRDILAQTPEMPYPFEPNYDLWANTLNQFILDENTILVGHSCGGGFILRYLSENNINVKRIILVAPWIDPNHDKAPEMFNFQINIQNLTQEITIFISKDDNQEILDSVEIIKSKLNNVKMLEFSNKKHFTFKDMGTKEFPELLEEILK